MKDLTYKFRFYKINEDGTIISKLFDTLEEVENGYDYFSPNKLVEGIYSNSYYLEKSNIKTRK